MIEPTLENLKVIAEDMRKEFLQYWEDNGEPHPSSNAYIALTRTFYFSKGIEFASKEIFGKPETDEKVQA